MIICSKCGTKCEDALDLGQHIKAEHPKGKVAPTRVAPDTNCPSCGYQINPLYWDSEVNICPKCCCHFNARNIDPDTGKYRIEYPAHNPPRPRWFIHSGDLRAPPPGYVIVESSRGKAKSLSLTLKGQG